MDLEPAQIAIPSLKLSLNHWVDNQVEPWRKPTVLYLAKDYIAPAHWVPLIYEVTAFTLNEAPDFKYLPAESFDIACVDNVLGLLPDLAARRELVGNLARICKRKIVAWNPACDDGKELIDALKRDGFSCTPYIQRRLRNQDIIHLRPHEAVFLKDFRVFPNGRGLDDFIKSEGIDLFSDGLEMLHKDFAINILNVGMVWKKDE